MYDEIGETNYTYGNVGNIGALKLTQVTNPYANATVSYGYDALGRLTSRKVMSDDLGTTLQSETYAYNGLGQLQTVGGNLGNTTLAYNGTTLQFTGLAYPNGMSTTFGYFNATLGGWLANITNNATVVGGNTALISQHAYTHTYTDIGFDIYESDQIATWQQTYPWNSAVAAQASNTTPVQQQMTAFTYDGSGWLTEAKFGQPNGNVTSPGVQAVWEDYTYGYDGAGNRLTGNVSGLANPANIGNLSGNLDTTSTLTGNFNTDNSLKYQTRSGRVEVAGTVSKPAVVTVNELPSRQWSLPGGVQWAFDSPLPLTINGTTTSNVTIRATDALNNVTTHTWTVPTGNVAANFTYDANGDMTSRVNEPGTSVAATANYTWSSIGQLLEVQQGNNTANFTYDGLGRMIELAANIGGNTTNEYYIWDGDQIIEKRVGGYDSSNITDDFYTYGYQTVNGGSNITGNYFETKDHLGSIREVVASDGQTVEGRYNYGPWGETTYTDYSGGNVTQPNFGYAGYFTTPYVPGIYLPVYRPYMPGVGWMTRDPLQELAGPNWYEYAHNDPIDNIDPLGLWQITIGGGDWFGGSISFGNNGGTGIFNGQWSVSSHVGVGTGFFVDLDPANSGCHTKGAVWSLNAEGSIGIGTNVNGNAHIEGIDDTSGNSWSVSASAGIPLIKGLEVGVGVGQEGNEAPSVQTPTLGAGEGGYVGFGVDAYF
jgi:RHS repeat-associated protein